MAYIIVILLVLLCGCVLFISHLADKLGTATQQIADLEGENAVLRKQMSAGTMVSPGAGFDILRRNNRDRVSTIPESSSRGGGQD